MAFQNSDSNKQPIVLYVLQIWEGISISDNNQRSFEQKLRRRFSNYGKIWSYWSRADRVHIGYGDEQSRNLAVANEMGAVFMNKTLKVSRYFNQLNHSQSIINLKLKNPNIPINVLQHCNNYWNQKIYPQHIIEDALKNGVTHFRVTAKRYNIHYYHKDVGYPFIIMKASKNRMKENIICVRPQDHQEILVMLEKCDLSLLRQVLTETNPYQVDWKYDEHWEQKPLLYHFARLKSYDKIKYMIDVIKCNPKDAIYELLHIAAKMHDEKLVNICLDEYQVNPLLRNEKENKTALEVCNDAWLQYKKKEKMNPENIIHFAEDEGELEGKHDEDIKSVSYEDVCIKSVLLSNFLYIHNQQNLCFCDVIPKYQEFAKFRLESVGNDQYLIKIVTASKSHKRMSELTGNINIKNDFVLTANIKENKIEFVAEKEEQKEVNYKQCWLIQKDTKGNESGYKFSVKIKDRKYMLVATQKCTLELEAEIVNQNNVIDDNEGSDSNAFLKSWFIVLKEHTFTGPGTFQWEQGDHVSLLQGDLEKCQLIHDRIVNKLEKAMKKEKLYGDNQGSDINNQHEDNNKPHKTRMNPPLHPPNYKHKGICKKWNDMKGYGFIKMNDGSRDVFVHKSEVRSRANRLFLDDNVEFNIVTQDDGRRKAINVDIIGYNHDNYNMNKNDDYKWQYDRYPYNNGYDNRYNNNNDNQQQQPYINQRGRGNRGGYNNMNNQRRRRRGRGGGYNNNNI